MLDDKSIIKSYKRVSSFYDYTFGKVFKPGQKKLVSMMECTSTDKVLEIGIGTGTSYSYYPNETAVIGIDISPDMLDKARNHIESNRLKNKSVVMMNGEQLKFEDNSYAYYLAPQKIKIGDKIENGSKKEIKIGNCMPLQDIPVGINIHNVEIQPGGGGKIARSAGTSVTISGLDGN